MSAFLECRTGLVAWLSPVSEEERAVIFAKLADAGLLATEAHQRFRDRPTRSTFFGVDCSVPGWSAKVSMP